MTVHQHNAHNRAGKTALRVNAADNVAVALSDIAAGTVLTISGMEIVARATIPAGHKIALAPVPAGGDVIKFGAPIGRAAQAITPGDHVQCHNLATALCDVEDYADIKPADRSNVITPSAETFMGYRRADGRVGVRNEIWILPTVGCVANTAERIAAEARMQINGRIDGVYAFAHPFGCSQLGDDLGGTRALLAALASHPNAGGALIIGLGCESNQIDALLKGIPAEARQRVRTLVSQAVEDEYDAGLAAVEELIGLAANDRREPCAVSDLVIGVKCGGSDGFSGLTANPLVGRMTDRVVATGGASVLTEIPEIFGAERPLLERCENERVFNGLVAVVNDFKRYFLEHNQPIYENPSPGNIRGGITTLEEKSLGAAQKAGVSAIVTSALRYGERVKFPGLAILESPGNDAVSSTALVAAGATVILFTTGRGTPLGFPAPTIKIASNSALAEKKPRWIDFDAGPSLDENERPSLEEDLWRLLIDVASGKPTRSEENGERSIAIWKRGVTL